MYPGAREGRNRHLDGPQPAYYVTAYSVVI